MKNLLIVLCLATLAACGTSSAQAVPAAVGSAVVVAAPPKIECALATKFAERIPESIRGVCDCWDADRTLCMRPSKTSMIVITARLGEDPTVKVVADWTPPPAPKQDVVDPPAFPTKPEPAHVEAPKKAGR